MCVGGVSQYCMCDTPYECSLSTYAEYFPCLPQSPEHSKGTTESAIIKFCTSVRKNEVEVSK